MVWSATQQQLCQQCKAVFVFTNQLLLLVLNTSCCCCCHCQVCIYKGFCVKGGNFAIIMKLYSYSLAARVARHPGAALCSHTPG